MSADRERLVERMLFGCALASMATTAGIVAVLAGESLAFFAEVPIADFLFDTTWTPRAGERHYGIWPLVAGTLLTVGVALAVALPIGVLAAIYLSEFASARTHRWLKPTLELLAGVPTIAYGYFALLLVTPTLQVFIPNLGGYNALGPGIVLGVLVVPIVVSLSEEAIRSVPSDLREAAYALGATRLQTLFGVVIPAARSGISASILLALSRAAGESMIVAIAAGSQARLTLDPRQPVETMTAHLLQVELGNIPAGTVDYHTIFAVGGALFLLTFAANAAGRRLVRRVSRR